jgi:hypothetical protein
MKGYNDTAEMRTDELMRAAKILGLKEVFFLGYRDSGMPGSEDNKHPNAQVAHPIDEVAGRVVKYIRELKPQVVLTFDPIGGYKHPDHIHIHRRQRLPSKRMTLPSTLKLVRLRRWLFTIRFSRAASQVGGRLILCLASNEKSGATVTLT